MDQNLFRDIHSKQIVRVTDEPGYLCHNTGNRVFIVQDVHTGETYEGFPSDFRPLSVLEALAALGD